MGAVIGALYAAGMTADEIDTLADSVTWRDVIDLSLQGGLIKGEKLAHFLAEHLPADFSQLERSLVVTTTDVESGEQVLLSNGDLITAVRASSSFPGAFEPLEHEGRTLADGGIINNLPVDAASFLGANWKVASNVTPARRATYVSPSEEGRFWERMLATVRLERRNPMLQMLLRSSDIMQSLLTDLHYTLHPADVLVKMELPDIRVESFWQFRSIVDAGEQAAEAVFAAHGLLPD
jgi:NTE family protein